MTPDPTSDKPPRRPRYRGTHPRQFQEKYKELQPEKYADDVARILDSGKTPVGMHRPIMVREIMTVLAPRPGETAVDCTLGYGGHAQELLAAVQPGGRLLGVDADPIELLKTEARLRELGYPTDAILIKRMNYAGVAQFLAGEAPEGADAILADLGLSSMQIDDPARGFSFKVDGPLDMRMNPNRGPSAAEYIAKCDVDELAEILADNADEPYAERIAAHIAAQRGQLPLTTTRSLAEVIRSACAGIARLSPEDVDATIRRVFQGIRIQINDEFGALETFLRQLPRCLKPGGRIAILTFHSGEDRRVKAAFKAGLADGTYASIAKDIIRASPDEQRSNPRSTSAKLRYAVRGSAS